MNRDAVVIDGGDCVSVSRRQIRLEGHFVVSDFGTFENSLIGPRGMAERPICTHRPTVALLVGCFDFDIDGIIGGELEGVANRVDVFNNQHQRYNCALFNRD